MIKCLLTGIAAASLVFGCAPDDRPITELCEEDQIREVVFRYQFEFNASGLGESAYAYYLGLAHGQDPTPELLSRFKGHAPPVKPLSASELEPGTAQVVDSQTKLPGIAFRITDIRWKSDAKVEVDGGYDEASESATGNTYHVVKQSGKWRVVESQMLWIK